MTSRDALHFQVMVFNKTGKPPVEAHTALARAPSYRRCLPVHDVLRRSQPVMVAGVTMLRPHPYDEMLHLCLHLTAQHNFDRLIWLVDIAQLLASYRATGTGMRSRAKSLGGVELRR